MNRGVAKMAIGKNSEAIEDYKKSIEINPEYPLVYANLGNAYQLNFDNEKACENWQKSLELGNENVRERIEINCK
jgi:tetratricopeptide (TPR) repeat protein